MSISSFMSDIVSQEEIFILAHSFVWLFIRVLGIYYLFEIFSYCIAIYIFKQVHGYKIERQCYLDCFYFRKCKQNVPRRFLPFKHNNSTNPH